MGVLVLGDKCTIASMSSHVLGKLPGWVREPQS
jgi:hypothetical protein